MQLCAVCRLHFKALHTGRGSGGGGGKTTTHRLPAQSELSDIVQGHDSCFYQGHVLEHPGWSATMSTCHGLRYALQLWREEKGGGGGGNGPEGSLSITIII